MKMSRQQDRRSSQRGGSVPPLETEVLFNLDFVCLVGSASTDSHSSFYAETLSAASASLEKPWKATDSVDPTLAQLAQTSRGAPVFHSLSAIFPSRKTDLVLTVSSIGKK